MINKEVNRFLPKWVKEKIEIIDRGQDIQAKVLFRIISTCYINSINFGYKSFYSTFTLLLIVWAESEGMKSESTPEAKRQDMVQTEKLKTWILRRDVGPGTEKLKNCFYFRTTGDPRSLLRIQFFSFSVSSPCAFDSSLTYPKSCSPSMTWRTCFWTNQIRAGNCKLKNCFFLQSWRGVTTQISQK